MMTKLEVARRTRGWTQSKLGWKARMTQSDISAIERGRKPYPAHAERLAKVLEMPVSELTQEATS